MAFEIRFFSDTQPSCIFSIPSPTSFYIALFKGKIFYKSISSAVRSEDGNYNRKWGAIACCKLKGDFIYHASYTAEQLNSHT